MSYTYIDNAPTPAEHAYEYSEALSEREGAPPEDPDVIKRDTRFYSDHIVMQVGNRLFKVPRRKFEDSEVFKDMFTLPAGDTAVDGSSDEKPLVLEGIEVAEFRALLQVMFRPYHGPTLEETKELTLDEWISVLKLTTMWGFLRLRRAAIDSLTPLLRPGNFPVLWISLARKYDVHEWLLPSLHALARRPQAQQVHEVEELGITTVVKMAEVRESYVLTYSNGYHRNAARSQHDFEAEIKRLFRDELEVVTTYHEKGY